MNLPQKAKPLGYEVFFLFTLPPRVRDYCSKVHWGDFCMKLCYLHGGGSDSFNGSGLSYILVVVQCVWVRVFFFGCMFVRGGDPCRAGI